MIPLAYTTPPTWFETARGDLEALLSDHLHCERKAAEHALGLVRKYARSRDVVLRLTRLAHEETSHLVQVQSLMDERGLAVRSDIANHYVRALLAQVRADEPDRKVDLLLCAALVEARSHERLACLARGFSASGDDRLGRFYASLGDAEARHADLYFELAEQAAPGKVAARLHELIAIEAAVVSSLPPGSRIH